GGEDLDRVARIAPAELPPAELEDLVPVGTVHDLDAGHRVASRRVVGPFLLYHVRSGRAEGGPRPGRLASRGLGLLISRRGPRVRASLRPRAPRCRPAPADRGPP